MMDSALLPGWEWMVLGFGLAVFVIYLAAYEWCLWRDTHRWARQLPIFGPPDVDRLNGSQSRPNIRRVR